jgi:hypothetical protein
LLASLCADLNHRRAGRCFGIADHELHGDAFRPQARDGVVSTGVGADAGDKRHARPEPRRGHRLIETFASTGSERTAVRHRHIGLRQFCGSYKVIRIDAAYDDHLTLLEGFHGSANRKSPLPQGVNNFRRSGARPAPTA